MQFDLTVNKVLFFFFYLSLHLLTRFQGYKADLFIIKTILVLINPTLYLSYQIFMVLFQSFFILDYILLSEYMFICAAHVIVEINQLCLHPKNCVFYE